MAETFADAGFGLIRVGDFCFDLVIQKAVAHQRKFLNLCFLVSESLPDGIFFSSLHQRRP